MPLEMTEYKHRVYFSADDGVHGIELWVTDGTEEGTQLFADINPGALRSSPQSFKVAGGLLFFVAIVPDDPHFHGTNPALGDQWDGRGHANGLSRARE